MLLKPKLFFKALVHRNPACAGKATNFFKNVAGFLFGCFACVDKTNSCFIYQTKVSYTSSRAITLDEQHNKAAGSTKASYQ